VIWGREGGVSRGLLNLEYRRRRRREGKTRHRMCGNVCVWAWRVIWLGLPKNRPQICFFVFHYVWQLSLTFTSALMSHVCHGKLTSEMHGFSVIRGHCQCKCRASFLTAFPFHTLSSQNDDHTFTLYFLVPLVLDVVRDVDVLNWTSDLSPIPSMLTELSRLLRRHG